MKIKYIIRRRFFWLTAAIFLWSAADGQYDGSVPVASPVTPNAAALFKAGDRPMGGFSGTIPVNIPLFTPSTGSLQVPVALDYNNGGIRVEEAASWAGLGWNLAAGGQITRAMRGTPDEDVGHGGILTSGGNIKPSGFPGTYYVSNSYYVVTGYWDEEPDIFYFNMLGMSGKFYFDESGNPHMISQQPLKIQYTITSNKISQFTITDEKGNQYIFGDTYVDYSYSTYTSANGYSSVPSAPVFNSTWHLKQIKDLSGEHVINFTYTVASTSLDSWSGEYMRIGGETGFDCLPADSYGDQVFVTTTSQEYFLSTIQAGNDSLVFYSSGYFNGIKLDSLRMFAKGSVRKNGFHLNTGFFNYYGGGYNVYTNRLELNNLSAFGSSGADSLIYGFTYNTTVNLPSRLSTGTDYWGYYNGNDYNWTTMPNGTYLDGGTYLPQYNLGDRRSNGYYAAANTLTQITYPTGGSRSFDYEGNQAVLDPDSQVMPDACTGLSYLSFSTPIYSSTFTVNSTDNCTNFSFNLTGYGYGTFYVKLTQIIGGFDYTLITLYNNYNDSYILQNGNYRVDFYEDINCNFTEIDCSWPEQILNSSFTSRYNASFHAQNMSVGGIRVSAVHDFDPLTGTTHTTAYKYYSLSDTTLTSGLLVTPVQVAHQGGCGNMTRDCYYIRLSSSSQYPLATEGGSYVVYPNVRTIESGNGYTDREYSFDFDQTPNGFDAMHAFPIMPAYDASWERGELVLEKIYNNSGQLLKRNASMGQGIYSSEWGPPIVPYTSQEYLLSYQTGWKVVGYQQSYGCNNTGFGLCEACWNNYTLQSTFAGIRSEMTTAYQPGGGNQIKQTDYNYWTDKGYPSMKTKTDYLQNGDTLRTHYCYGFNSAGDFVLGLSSTQYSWLSTLQSYHYLAPIEVTTTVTTAGSSTASFVDGYKYVFTSVSFKLPDFQLII